MVYEYQTKWYVQSINELFSVVSDNSVSANDNIVESSSSIFAKTGHINFETKDVFDALMGLDIKKNNGLTKCLHFYCKNVLNP